MILRAERNLYQTSWWKYPYLKHFFQVSWKSLESSKAYNTLPSRHRDVAKTSKKRFNFGFKDVLDWSDMEIYLFLTRRQDVFQETSWRRLPGDVLKTSFRRRRQNVFQEMSSRGLPEDALKTSSRRLKTSSRLFPVNGKDNLETIYELSISVRFKLLTCYHTITRQTNWINLLKLNTLNHGNNGEFMKTWFSMNCRTRKHFLQKFKYFLAS